MVTWIPSIHPIHVSIYTSTMDPSWDMIHVDSATRSQGSVLGPLGVLGDPACRHAVGKKTDQAMRVTSWFIHMWVFINGGIPNSWMVYFMENPKIKYMIKWGNPILRKPPNIIILSYWMIYGWLLKWITE